MHQMGFHVLSPSASCECGAASQTAHHMTSECPLHSCNGDLVVLDIAARNWLRDLQCAAQTILNQTQEEKEEYRCRP